MAYFITDEDSTKGRNPNINIINGIHNIKGKTFVNILVFNCTNTLCSTKLNMLGHLEPAIEDSAYCDFLSHAQQITHSINSITTQRMMAE